MKWLVFLWLGLYLMESVRSDVPQGKNLNFMFNTSIYTEGILFEFSNHSQDSRGLVIPFLLSAQFSTSKMFFFNTTKMKLNSVQFEPYTDENNKEILSHAIISDYKTNKITNCSEIGLGLENEGLGCFKIPLVLYRFQGSLRITEGFFNFSNYNENYSLLWVAQNFSQTNAFFEKYDGVIGFGFESSQMQNYSSISSFLKNNYQTQKTFFYRRDNDGSKELKVYFGGSFHQGIREKNLSSFYKSSFLDGKSNTGLTSDDFFYLFPQVFGSIYLDAEENFIKDFHKPIGLTHKCQIKVYTQEETETLGNFDQKNMSPLTSQITKEKNSEEKDNTVQFTYNNQKTSQNDMESFDSFDLNTKTKSNTTGNILKNVSFYFDPNRKKILYSKSLSLNEAGRFLCFNFKSVRIQDIKRGPMILIDKNEALKTDIFSDVISLEANQIVLGREVLELLAVDINFKKKRTKIYQRESQENKIGIIEFKMGGIVLIMSFFWLVIAGLLCYLKSPK